MLERFIGLALLGCVFICPAFAQDGLPATQPDSPAEKLKQFLTLQEQLLEQFRNKDYQAAADTSRRMIELAPSRPEGHYNLGCALARDGKADEALAAIEKAVELGFSDTAHIKADDDLENLRADKRFTDLLARVRAREKELADRRYEKGEELEGVKTVEGDPEGGLRFRLRMSPKAAADRPSRVVIWLHPSGGSMNNVVERMAPIFVEQGFALMVLTAKEFGGWTAGEADKLMTRTLSEAAKVEGIDGTRPILFGYSAGGQMALMLWNQSPEKFGGLILDAAYPVRMEVTAGQGRMALLAPPGKEGIKSCPFFVLVGERDGGAQVWQRAEDIFRKAGVPLTIYYVAGQGHAWLFGGAQRAKLADWLGQVAGGRMPDSAASQPDQPPPATQPTRPIRIDNIY